MGLSAAWFYEGQLRLHQNNNNNNMYSTDEKVLPFWAGRVASLLWWTCCRCSHAAAVRQCWRYRRWSLASALPVPTATRTCTRLRAAVWQIGPWLFAVLPLWWVAYNTGLYWSFRNNVMIAVVAAVMCLCLEGAYCVLGDMQWYNHKIIYATV